MNRGELKMNLKIALLQILPGDSLEKQFQKGKDACEKAKAMDADIALFPEMWSDGYAIPQAEMAINPNFKIIPHHTKHIGPPRNNHLRTHRVRCPAFRIPRAAGLLARSQKDTCWYKVHRYHPACDWSG